MLAACADTIYEVYQGLPFAAHRDALRSEGALCGQLARLLLPCLAASAIGLQLPTERKHPHCTWLRAQHVAGALNFLCRACALSPKPIILDSGSIPRIVQLAAQLAAGAPALEQLATMLDLLGVAAWLCRRSVLTQRTLAPQQATQLTRHLLSALPKFALVLPIDEARLAVLACLRDTAILLTALMDSLAPSACSLDDVSIWCTGAAAALRLLAPLVA